MKNGDVVYMPGFTHTTPMMKVGYRAPKGKTFVFVLLGVADKKNPSDFNPDQALRDMGWSFKAKKAKGGTP